MRSHVLIAVVVAAAAAAVIPGLPAHATADATAQRISGDTRYATAAAVAERAFPNGNRYAALANGSSFADALGGAFLAGSTNGPILLTTANTLPAETKAALVQLGVNDLDVFGGTLAVSDAVLAQLPPGITTHRWAGPTRYDTNVAMVGEGGGSVNTINGDKTAVIADGQAFPDAISAAGLASRGYPILITPPNALPAATGQLLQYLAVKQVLIMGGTASVSAAVEDQIHALGITTLKRFAGADRYDTAAQLATFENSTPDVNMSAAETVLYRGDDFADSMSASGYTGGGGARGTGLVQLPAGPGGAACGSLNPSIAQFLSTNAGTVKTLTILGGTAGVCDAEVGQALAAVGASAAQ